MRYLFVPLLLALSTTASAQEATLNAPEVLPSPAAVSRLVVAEVLLTRSGGSVTVEFQAGTTPRRARTYAIAAGEMASFVTAIDTARSGETGGVARRFNFRVLGWLVDNSKIVDDSAVVIPVTLVP